MNPAEEIVKFWLQEKGYFLQSSIVLPRRKEIDILAIHPETGEKLHIEVSVSILSINPRNNAEDLAKEKSETKFIATGVQEEVEKVLGKDYKKMFVTGRVSFRGQDILKRFIDECKKLNIEVKYIQDILDEIKPILSTHNQLNPIIKTIQIVDSFQ